MIFQDPMSSLNLRRTVFAIIAAPLRLHKFDRVEIWVKEALDMVGLPRDFKNRYPHDPTVFLEPIEVFNPKTRSKLIDPAALVYCLVSHVVIYALTMEKAKGSDMIFEDILTDVTGVYTTVMIDGDMDVGAWSCGVVAGLLDGIMA